MDTNPPSSPGPVETPQSTPEPTSAPETFGSENNSTNPLISQETPPAPKKKKGPLIIILAVVAFLLIAGVVVALILFQDTPEKKANTASMKLYDTFSAIAKPEASNAENKNVKIDGLVSVSSESLDENVSLNFVFEANDESDARVIINNISGIPVEGLESLGLEFRELSKENDYIKLSGLKNLLSLIYTFNSSSYYGYGSYGYEYNGISSLISEIDDEWIEIDLGEVISTLSEDLGASMTIGEEKASEETADCVISELKQFLEDNLFKSEEIAKIFSLVYEENGSTDNRTLYTLKINSEEVANFINNYLEKAESFGDELMKTCNIDSETASSAKIQTPDKVKTEDVEKALDNIPKISVVINNNKEISEIYTTFSNGTVNTTIELKLSYPKTLEIEKPGNAKPLSDILEDLETIFSSMYSPIIDPYYDPYGDPYDDELDEDTASCLKKEGFNVKTYDELYDDDDAWEAYMTKC